MHELFTDVTRATTYTCKPNRFELTKGTEGEKSASGSEEDSDSEDE
jgi:hypothetical protein